MYRISKTYIFLIALTRSLYVDTQIEDENFTHNQQKEIITLEDVSFHLGDTTVFAQSAFIEYKNNAIDTITASPLTIFWNTNEYQCSKGVICRDEAEGCYFLTLYKITTSKKDNSHHSIDIPILTGTLPHSLEANQLCGSLTHGATFSFNDISTQFDYAHFTKNQNEVDLEFGDEITIHCHNQEIKTNRIVLNRTDHTLLCYPLTYQLQDKYKVLYSSLFGEWNYADASISSNGDISLQVNDSVFFNGTGCMIINPSKQHAAFNGNFTVHSGDMVLHSGKQSLLEFENNALLFTAHNMPFQFSNSNYCGSFYNGSALYSKNKLSCVTLKKNVSISTTTKPGTSLSCFKALYSPETSTILLQGSSRENVVIKRNEAVTETGAATIQLNSDLSIKKIETNGTLSTKAQL